MKRTLTIILGAIAAPLAASFFFVRTRAVLACRRGENFVDSGFKILIVVVLAAILLAGLYILFGDVIMPKLTERVTELFNYSAT
jgi:NADH:ubiquinone oxidoreductase subunit H